LRAASGDLHLTIRHLLRVAAGVRSVGLDKLASYSGRNNEGECGGGAGSSCTLAESASINRSAPTAAGRAETSRVEGLGFVFDELDSERLGDVTSVECVSSEGRRPRSDSRPSVGRGNNVVMFGAIVLLVAAMEGDMFRIEVTTLAAI